MASKKYIELKEFSNEELNAVLVETQEKYGKLKFDHGVRGVENPLLLKEVRRDIARLNTEVRSRELAEMDDKGLAKRSKLRSRRRKS